MSEPYSVDLGSSEWSDNVILATYVGALDDHESASVVVASTQEEIASLSESKLPKTMRLKWKGRKVFDGKIRGASIQSGNRLELRFDGGSAQLGKWDTNGFVKSQTLQQCLSSLSEKSGLSAHFQGSFSENLPGVSLSDGDQWKKIQDLARRFGFFVSVRSAEKKIHFIRPGKSVSNQSVGFKDDVMEIGVDAQSGLSWESVKLRYFEAKSLEAKERQFSRRQLYGQLGSFGDEKRDDWAAWDGAREAAVSDQYLYSTAEKRLSNQLSKVAISGKATVVSATEFMGFPGDELKVSDAPTDKLVDGKLFVKEMRLVIDRAVPICQVTAVRA